mmetsp:Transcript_48031/g.138323  ORF Transcript_48031/g.138323 Transcript_48031/m.138323 type:complete len:319 (+) Transcript_48031:808-1764(+)
MLLDALRRGADGLPRHLPAGGELVLRGTGVGTHRVVRHEAGLGGRRRGARFGRLGVVLRRLRALGAPSHRWGLRVPIRRRALSALRRGLDLRAPSLFPDRRGVLELPCVLGRPSPAELVRGRALFGVLLRLSWFAQLLLQVRALPVHGRLLGWRAPLPFGRPGIRDLPVALGNPPLPHQRRRWALRLWLLGRLRLLPPLTLLRCGRALAGHRRELRALLASGVWGCCARPSRIHWRHMRHLLRPLLLPMLLWHLLLRHVLLRHLLLRHLLRLRNLLKLRLLLRHLGRHLRRPCPPLLCIRGRRWLRPRLTLLRGIGTR